MQHLGYSCTSVVLDTMVQLYQLYSWLCYRHHAKSTPVVVGRGGEISPPFHLRCLMPITTTTTTTSTTAGQTTTTITTTTTIQDNVKVQADDLVGDDDTTVDWSSREWFTDREHVADTHVSIHPYFKVHPGKMEEFVELTSQMVDLVCFCCTSAILHYLAFMPLPSCHHVPMMISRLHASADTGEG
jgi:hypothetical protein